MKYYRERRKVLFITLTWLLILTGCGKKIAYKPGEANKNWPVYLGGKSSSQYSPLTQITPQNITKLEQVWEYHSEGGTTGKRTQIQCNPIIIDGVLYATSPTLKVFALQAATGTRIWEFNPNKEINYARNVNRGVTFWSGDEGKRILFTAGEFLYELDALSGELIKTFGKEGKVSLREGLGMQADDKYVVSTTPGIIYHDILIIGTRVAESANAAPGYIRAFNVKSGKLEWVFHTIPQPGEFGYDTWPEDAWKVIGGANSWSGMSLDEVRGMVFIPTGSASFDFWGGNRKGENLFANCVLALDAATGKRIWHVQTVHHDIWDRDLPAPPNLVSVRHHGKKTDAVAQITKSGFVFLLDRETGAPLFPVEEKPFPGSDLEGEETWPTQPIPVKPPPFSNQALTLENASDISLESNRFIKDSLKKLRTGSQFIPPSEDGTVIFPGFDGGGEWGGAAYDPQTSVLYVSGSVMPWVQLMVKVESANSGTVNPAKILYDNNCAVCHGPDRAGKTASNYPSLLNLRDRSDRKEVEELLNTGKGFMPSYRHLKKEEKEVLIDYLFNVKTGANTGLKDIENNPSQVPYRHTGYNRFVDQDGYPAVQPPWGTLTAIDLNKGEILYQVPLGEFEELSRKGIPKTGTENYGGPVVSAGGLIFIAASKDEYFRAFDKKTGEELWKYKLPAGGYATPAVYEVDGKQFVVIACGGGKMGTPSGDSYIAFALK